MKTYKLKDLVANGSHSRIKVDSDVIVGDLKNGYGYGDILDANAVKEIISQMASQGDNSYQELLEKISAIDLLNLLQNQRLDELEQKPTVSAEVDGDRVIFN